jgi:hypothetical protein
MRRGLGFDHRLSAGPKSNFAIIVIASILCLSPLLGLAARGLSSEDNINYFNRNNPHLAASLFVATVPAIDFLFDLLSLFLFDRTSDEKSLKRCFNTNAIIRFNDTERLCFIIGIAAQSSDWFLPLNTDLTIRLTVITCTENLSILLILTPIVTFLQRCTSTFNKCCTFLQIFTISLGMSLISISHFYGNDKNAFDTLKLAGISLTIVFGVTHVTLIVICGLKYCREKLGTPEKRKVFFYWVLTHFQMTTLDKKRETPWISARIIERDRELYTNYIPAFHMASSFILIIGEGFVVYHNTYGHVNINDPRVYFIIAAEVLVLVVELRIRKNEIARGLVRKPFRIRCFLAHFHRLRI